ncbi:MAG: hypothetical protein M1840_001166 [Geoglossum simile]|nr:MAG: hypothetical protein M1840_001166 [Geoglossum simile]
MAPPNRSLDRNIHFSDERNPDTILGGLIQNGSVTEKNFLSMFDMILVTTSPIRVYAKATGILVLQTDVPLQLGNYIVSCDDRIHVSNEAWLHRVISYSVSGRDNSFRDGVRARDGKCVISGIRKKSTASNWSPFEASHIFPLELESLWVQFNYGRWVDDIDDDAGISKINSCQNGLLLRSDVHKDFDQYLLSVNSDDGYKVTVFGADTLDMDGRVLDPSILVNVRGEGEPIFEHDFPPGTDMMKEIREGPYAQERFERELAARFRDAEGKDGGCPTEELIATWRWAQV